jgi:hypothetical protein
MAGRIDVEPGPNPYDNAVSEEKLVSLFERLTQTQLSIPGR